MVNITKEFLEEALGEDIQEFTTTAGSSIGDGHSSLMYALEVRLARTPEQPVHFVLKCYPANPGRQDMLSRTNSFSREYQVYHSFVPKLIKFQTKSKSIYTDPTGHPVIQPPFTRLVYGRAVHYTEATPEENLITSDPLENCLILPDLRKEGFRLANRFTGFTLDESKLVIQAQARLHALSWAYKLLTNVNSLSEKFPFMQGTFFDSMKDDLMKGYVGGNLEVFQTAIEHTVTDNRRKNLLVESLKQFLPKAQDIAALYFSDTKTVTDPSINKDTILRVPQTHHENEHPWLVATHGDCWLNNLMFKYDEMTGKPLEVVLIDLQFTRENDPCADLAYSIYTSTSAALRKDHLDDLLKLYCLTFIQICEHFKVVPLPGFQLSELKRRFHRAKIFGMLMAVIGLPLFLMDKEQMPDMEKSGAENMEELGSQFAAMTSSMKNNTRFTERVVELVSELWAAGIL